MIVLDTTVLVYATGGDHPFRDPCRDLVAAISRGDVEATTSAPVVQEFVHVRARRRSRADAADLGAAFADLLAPLLPVTAESLADGLRLYRDATGLGAFDAVLAAAALSAGAEALVSADAGFAVVRGLRHITPDAPSVAALLGA